MPQNYNKLRNTVGAAWYNTSTSDTSYFSIPKGTTAQRPSVLQDGFTRYNTTIGKIEYYDSIATAWMAVNSYSQGTSMTLDALVVAGGGGGAGYGSRAGGGGGAGGIGSNGGDNGGTSNGGIGVQSQITGSAVYRAGGGGGSRSTGVLSGGHLGGTGGGGAGATTTGPGTSGTANTGGGGGGSYGSGQSGSTGGSGVVILRYLASYTINFTPGITASTVTLSGYKITTVTAGTGTATFTIG